MARSDRLLDTLPLDLLLALQEAVADPTADGQERARVSAKKAGHILHCLMRPDGPEGVDDPLPMPSGEDPGEHLTARLVFGAA